MGATTVIGLRFEEVMKGRLAPQSLDADRGYDDTSGIAASFHARIDIDDLDVFIAYRDNHRGRLRATLDIPVLGEDPFTVDDGRFELFRPGVSPVDGGSVWVMVYDGFLDGNGRVYMMRGRKYLKPRRLRPLRLWPETTTLEVELRDVTHGGRVDVGPSERDVSGGDSFADIPEALRIKMDADGGIPDWLAKRRDEVGKTEGQRYRRDFGRPGHLSGILHISPGGFARQMTTMRATGVPLHERPVAVLRFLMFFAGSLVRIYLRRNGPQVPV